MREKGRPVDPRRIAGAGQEHGGHHSFKLRPQQIIFRLIMRVERRSANARFLNDVAHTNVSIGAMLQQLNECGIDAHARAPNTLVVRIDLATWDQPR